jgi:DNA repair exonuclease SbcCD nuclease subunit
MISLPLPEGGLIKNIIHISDIHIRLGDRKTSRYDEYDEVFNKLYSEVVKKYNIYTVIIITGDIFHNKNRIDNYGILLFNKIIGMLSQLCPVYIIQGNHDYQQHLSKDEPDILEASLEYITNYNTANNIFYLKNTGHYVANNIGFGLVSIKDSLNEGNTFGKVSQLPLFPSISAFPSSVKMHIALFHGGVSNYTSYKTYKSTNSSYPLDWFDEYDIVLLGDIHLQQINNATLLNDNKYSFDGKKTWAYAGSLIQQNYGEPLYNHGYLDWDLENKFVSSHHIINTVGYIKISSENELEELINNQKCPNYLYIRNNYSIDKHIIDSILLKYNKHGSIIYNHEFKKTIEYVDETRYNSNIDNNESANTIYSLIEYISSNITHSNNEWIEWIKQPDKLLIKDNIESLNDIFETRNKILTKHFDTFNTSKDTHNISHKILNLEHMEWGWLLCFKNNCWFNFNEINSNNIAVINSPNGYGKSSFLEIICLSLFGESIPSRYSKFHSSSIICQKIPENEKAYTNIFFKINNELYKIHRKFDYKFNDKYKLDNCITELYKCDENYNKIIHKGKTAVQSWISQYIGTIDTFLLSTLITQNTDNDFFGMKSAEQNNIIDNSLNLDLVNNISFIFKEIVKTYKFIKTNASTVYNHINNNMSCDVTDDILDDYKYKISSLQQERIDYLTSINTINILHNYDSDDVAKSIDEIDKIINDYKKGIEKSLTSLTSLTLNKPIEQLYEDKGRIYSYILDYTVNPENISEINIIKHENEYSKNLSKYQEHLKDSPSHSHNTLIEFKNINDKIIELYGSLDNLKNIISVCPIKNPPHLSIAEINKKIDINDKYTILSEDYYDNKIITLKKNIESLKKTAEIYNIVNKEYINLLQHSVKKPIIDISEIKEFIKLYSIAIKNNNKEKLLNKIKAYNDIISIKKEIGECNNIINKYNSHDYNDNCWACKKQLWKIELEEYKSKKMALENDYKNMLKITEKQHTTNVNKLKFIIDNENKYNEYCTLKNEWKDYDNWYNRYSLIKEKLDRIDISTRDKLYHDLDETYKLKELNNYHIYKENWKKYNEYIKLIELYNKIPRTYTSDSIEKELQWYNNKDYMENDIEVAKNKLNILKSKKYLWEYNEILDNINIHLINDKIAYWNDIIKIKPSIEYKKLLEHKLDIVNSEITKISNELYKCSALYDEYNNKKKDLKIYMDFIENINNKLELLENIISKFGNYRSWLYKEKIIPKITEYTNSIIENITDRHLRLDSTITDDCTVQWYFQDGTNRPIIEKASGFQKFILGISIRIALSNLAGMKCNQLFIDEGFVACDAEHLSKVPNFLMNLLNIYNNVVVVSHLDSIKEMNAVQINITRKNDLSKIQFGNKL